MLESGKIAWRSPSNIALIKYWGKKGFQLSGNPSVSMSLTFCYTETVIEYNYNGNLNGPSFSLLFQGDKNIRFEKKISQFLKIATKVLPILSYLHLKIDTTNSFPHSSGIGSSASSMSSLALCLCHIDQEVSGNDKDEEKFFRRASYLARLGSGSACRSIYGGWVLWGETTGIECSSDEYAIPIANLAHKKFSIYYDSILIVNSVEKQVNSSLGHKLMESNPYKEIRVKTGKSNSLNLINAMKSGNEKMFRKIVENEAANLHAMFLTSNPYFVLIKPETLHILNKLEQFRAETGLGFSFTLDAGPNIHLLYPANIRDIMLPFIISELTPFCENSKWVDDIIGNGPEIINS